MNSKLFILLLTLLQTSLVYSYENDFALKGGISTAFSHLKYIDSSQDNALGIGFNTNFGYKFKRWEFNLTSFIAFGEMEKLTYQIGNTRVQGDGSFNHVNFAPTARYYFDVREDGKWKCYLYTGPVWSLNTFKLEDFTVESGNFNKKYRYSYTSRGWLLALGFEEGLSDKDLKPTFIEVLYSYQNAYEVALLDNSDFKNVETLNSDKVRTNIYTSILMINFGIVFF
mgnify:CR=1 FL=1